MDYNNFPSMVFYESAIKAYRYLYLANKICIVIDDTKSQLENEVYLDFLKYIINDIEKDSHKKLDIDFIKTNESVNENVYWKYDLVIENKFLRNDTTIIDKESQSCYIISEIWQEGTGIKKANLYHPLWWTNEEDLENWRKFNEDRRNNQ